MRANECLCFCNKRNNFYSNELNEVVISDSKFAGKRKVGKVIVKITSEELSKKSGQSLAAILSTVAGLEINGKE
jgi:vitamin B12 transporter